MGQHKTKVVRNDNESPKAPLLHKAVAHFKLPPKIDRVIPQNEQPYVRSKTAVDGAGNSEASNVTAQAVRVVELPPKRDPTLKLSQIIDLSVAPNGVVGSYLKINAQGNCLLYADSSNGSDRLLVKYAQVDGDQTAPNRVQVPGRLRREAKFNYLYVTWTVTAGALATIEVYDDPDRQLEIIG